MLVLAGVLAACSPTTPGSDQTSGVTASSTGRAAPSADAGARIYDGNCVPCHQQNGAGIPGVYPSLAGSPVVLGDTNELARWVLRAQRPPSMPPGRYSTQMPQFGWMKAADAAALFTYLRSSFGNSAAPVAADTVASSIEQ
jgi:mono/diheme cytochrome c family protein